MSLPLNFLLYLQMIDQMMQIRKMYCGDDESLLHRHDFDWLYEALIKVSGHCIAGQKISECTQRTFNDRI